MPRKGQVEKRKIDTDPIYGSRMVAKLISRTMRSGKKSVAARQVYAAFDLIQEKTNQDPLVIFNQALENLKPVMEVRPRRVGGAAYQVPMPVRGPRRESLAARWLIKAAQNKSNKEYHTFAEKLATEILDASNNTGEAIRKRETVHRMAEANKAFAHFRW